MTMAPISGAMPALGQPQVPYAIHDAPGPSSLGAWASQGACRDEDPELFFPISSAAFAPAQVARAKAVCARCRVTAQCLGYALATSQDGGVWGGTTEEERRALRQQRARGPAVAGSVQPASEGGVARPAR